MNIIDRIKDSFDVSGLIEFQKRGGLFGFTSRFIISEIIDDKLNDEFRTLIKKADKNLKKSNIKSIIALSVSTVLLLLSVILKTSNSNLIYLSISIIYCYTIINTSYVVCNKIYNSLKYKEDIISAIKLWFSYKSVNLKLRFECFILSMYHRYYKTKLSKGMQLLHSITSPLNLAPNHDEIIEQLKWMVSFYFKNFLKKKIIRIVVISLSITIYALIIKVFIVNKITNMGLIDYFIFPLRYITSLI